MAKKTSSVRRGNVYAVTFLDHCEGASTEPILFTVFGRLVNVAKDSLTFACWDYANPVPEQKTRNISDSNRTTFIIVRSAIQKLTKLVEA